MQAGSAGNAGRSLLRLKQAPLQGLVLVLVSGASLLLLLLIYHFLAEPPASACSPASQPWASCHQVSKKGLCIPDVLDVMDQAYRPLWPGQVDILIRSYFSTRLYLLGPLWRSLDLLWPKGLGQVVLVLDEGDAARGAELLVPPWVAVKYEKNYLGLPGKVLQQWSYGWADNYTSAPFIAILDDDVVLNLKVTPFLLFNVSTGLPYLIGSKEQGYYRATTDFFLGRAAYVGNFMVALPFIQPRAALPLYRQKVAEQHSKARGGYDEVMQWWAQNGGETREQIAHTVMGNFLAKYAGDMVEPALEWSDHVAVPRVGVHIPYTHKFMSNGGTPRADMLNSTSFLATAAFYLREAVCFSLPPGEAPQCSDMAQEPSHIWRYAWDRERWRSLRKSPRTAKELYREHTRQLHCMYNELADLFPAGLRGQEWLRRGRDKVARRLRLRCIHEEVHERRHGSGVGN